MNREIKILKKALKGHYQEVADKADMSKSMVSLVLNEKYVNEKIIKAAVEVKKELEKRKKAEIERITKLLAQQ